MKLLSLCAVVSCLLGAWVGLKERPPVFDASALRAERDDLTMRLQRTLERPPSAPVYAHWKRAKKVIESFEGVRLLGEVAAKLDGKYPHRAWVGKIGGPTMPVLLAARKAQKFAPVYFDNLSVRNGRAELRVHVWGG